jgi:hypothetical protein
MPYCRYFGPEGVSYRCSLELNLTTNKKKTSAAVVCRVKKKAITRTISRLFLENKSFHYNFAFFILIFKRSEKTIISTFLVPSAVVD